ncbi:phosphotransferase [Mycolicibacterium fortuitum]|uniref:phosphotransferase n=1 Tax=Mycolicibacterium fortuitum TaxID=1766 RepID=UPI0009BEE7CF|nr:phosphotransferase [Mycolicibacterium fortuitum]
MTQVHGSGPARIPSEIDAVTVGWLTEALRADPALPDTATVTEMRAEQIAMDSGFSSLLYRLHLAGEDVPATVIVKLPAQSEARGAMDLLGGYRRELAFYQRVAGHAPIATPHVHAARMVEGSVDFVLVMEDLQQWDNADHLAGLSLERARVAIDQLAGLHAWSITVADPTLINEFPSLDTPMARDLFLPVFGLGWQVYREHSSRTVPMPVARFAERFVELAPQALTALTERAMLLHGDIRADNMFFDGDRLKVVDFQFASHGAGAADIGYLVSQCLPSEVRRGRDEALVREYLGKLGTHGFVDYHFDEAWRHYRFAVGYLMVLPVITLVGWDTMPERSRQLCLTLVDRAVAAIDEIDALEVFA